MFLPRTQARPQVNPGWDPEFGGWFLVFDPANVDRWLLRLTVRGGPPGSTIVVQIEGQEDTIPAAVGAANALRFASGELFIPQGAHVYVLWNIGTGTTPRAYMTTELATSRNWEELEQLK